MTTMILSSSIWHPFCNCLDRSAAVWWISLNSHFPRRMEERRMEAKSESVSPVTETKVENEHHRAIKNVLDAPSTQRLYPHDGQGEFMSADEFNTTYLRQNKWTRPLLFKEYAALGIKLPDDLSVQALRNLIGPRKQILLQDGSLISGKSNKLSVTTRRVSIKDWEKIFTGTMSESSVSAKQKLARYATLPIDFTAARLGAAVQIPTVVRAVDWVAVAWPRHLISLPPCESVMPDDTDATTLAMSPQTLKQCIATQKGCWQDFETAPGGASVWHTCVKGHISFLLSPPCDGGLHAYLEFRNGQTTRASFMSRLASPPPLSNAVASSHQSEQQQWSRVDLTAGQTLFIPAGWICGRLSQTDSITIGGCFLHSFAIQTQLRVMCIERLIRTKYHRYPFWTELLWYVLDRYIFCLRGRHHCAVPPLSGAADQPQHQHHHHKLTKVGEFHTDALLLRSDEADQGGGMTEKEYDGLTRVVLYLHHLPPSEKRVPQFIEDAVALIADIRALLLDWHRKRPSRPDSTVVAAVGADATLQHGQLLHSKQATPTPTSVTNGGNGIAT